MRAERASTIIGVFKGMGDLLSAAPVIYAELERGISVHVLLFPGAAITEFANLIDYAPYQENMHVHNVPTGLNLRLWRRFLREMRGIQPDLVWISPCAPAADSSWKIPILLRTILMLFWRNARLVGTSSERMSWLFHQRLPVDRLLPLMKREWSAYRLLRGSDLPIQAPKINFVPEITAQCKTSAFYDLVIHPGANAINRKWPMEKYGPLIDLLPREWRIAMVGLPDDLAQARRILPPDHEIAYISGTIRDSIETLASARMLLVMDSGNMHFAHVLGVPAVAIFGYTDPSNIIDPHSCVKTIYEQRFPCQPCKKAVCSQPAVFCLQGVEPSTVAGKLRSIWDSLNSSGAVYEASHISMMKSL